MDITFAELISFNMLIVAIKGLAIRDYKSLIPVLLLDRTGINFHKYLGATQPSIGFFFILYLQGEEKSRAGKILMKKERLLQTRAMYTANACYCVCCVNENKKINAKTIEIIRYKQIIKN